VPAGLPVYSEVVRLISRVAGAGRRFRPPGQAGLGARELGRRCVPRGRQAGARQFGHERWF